MTTALATATTAKKTLDLLWERIRKRGDLPGFSRVVSTILNAMQAEDDREFNMTKTVLSDPALTQRVLKLANSAMYSVFGQNINTVSKAVIVLGTEAVGHLALGLRLIDGLSSASDESDTARNEMEKAVLAGHIARQVAGHASTRDVEEAVVCSMLHSLGRMVTVFYLPEYWDRIRQAVAAGKPEEAAALEVMGISLDELGRTMAKRWGLPPSLINSMQTLPSKSRDEPLNHDDWLAAISTMSTACADVISESGIEATSQLAAIADNYTPMLGLDTTQLLDAIKLAHETAKEEAVISRPTPAEPEAQRAAERRSRDKLSPLANGVADMHGIAGSANSSQMVTMALETLYKGLGLCRAIFFLRSPDQNYYLPRLCFGDGVQELIPHLAFNSAYQPDVFHAALANDKIIFVENAQEPNFTSRLPLWWRDNFPNTRSFVVLPLTLKRQPIGFMYGDWDQLPAEYGRGMLEIAALEDLSKLVARAIEERRRVEPGWMV